MGTVRSRTPEENKEEAEMQNIAAKLSSIKGLARKAPHICAALALAICAGYWVGNLSAGFAAGDSAPSEETVEAQTEEEPLSVADAESEEENGGEDSSGETAGKRTEPDFETPFFVAVQAYRAYLLNLRGAEGVVPRITDLASYGEPGSAFTLIDMDDDGIPELHVRGEGGYCVFGYKDEKISLWAKFESDTVLLHNRAFFTHDWKNENTYEYNEFDFRDTEKGRIATNKFKFRYSDYAGIQRYGTGRNGVLESWETVSREEYERVTGPYTEFAENNSDMIPWTDYEAWSKSNADEYAFPGKSPFGPYLPW
jgi:hypothetical protein